MTDYSDRTVAQLKHGIARGALSPSPELREMAREMRAELARRGLFNPVTRKVVSTWNADEAHRVMQPFIDLSNTVEQNERLQGTATPGWTSAGGRVRITGPRRFALDAYTAVRRGELTFAFVANRKLDQAAPIFFLFGAKKAGLLETSDIEQLKRRAIAWFTLDNLLTEGLPAWRAVVEQVRAAPLPGRGG